MVRSIKGFITVPLIITAEMAFIFIVVFFNRLKLFLYSLEKQPTESCSQKCDLLTEAPVYRTSCRTGEFVYYEADNKCHLKPSVCANYCSQTIEGMRCDTGCFKECEAKLGIYDPAKIQASLGSSDDASAQRTKAYLSEMHSCQSACTTACQTKNSP